MAILANLTHETNDFSQYDTTYLDGGNLSIAAAAALAQTVYGMSVNFPGGTTTAKYAVKNIALSTNNCRARFYFDPNTFTLIQYVNNWIFSASSHVTGYSVFRANIKWDTQPYHILVESSDDAGGTHGSANKTITDAPHCIEISTVRATTNISADGTCQLWIDGVDQGTITGIDNYDLFPTIDRVNVGFYAGGNVGQSGTYYLDEVIVNDTGTLIGPYLGAGKAGLAFGANSVTAGESPVPWPTWDNGAAGAITVSGDANWGKMELDIGEEGRSAVYDLGDANPRTYTLTLNRYGTGSGTSTLQIRGQAAAFVQDDNVLAWTTYTVPILESWRYIQVREIKSS